MFRTRMVGVLAAAFLLTAACGDDGGGVDATAGQQPEPEAPATTEAEPGDSPATDDAEAGIDATDDAEAGIDAADDAATSGAASDDPDGVGPSEDAEPGAPVDAGTLLASATTELGGRSVRGEATFDLAPGFGLRTTFESDADGDLAALIELPPGFDSEYPAGADAEMRYVGGAVYVRPPVPAETLTELGVEEAWYIAEPFADDDPFSDAMASGGGLMCVFPQAADAVLAECDPLGDTGSLLEGASAPEIVGREDVRGTEATRVRFQVSLMDLMGEAMGQTLGEDDAGTTEGEFFDDGSTDPFAEGIEEFFAMLDTGFEVEVWIDDDNLIRRLAYDLASMFGGFAGPDDVIPSSLITVEFLDFDADISVDAPPPEAIVDEDLLVGGDDDDEYDDEYDDDYYDDEYDDDY